MPKPKSNTARGAPVIFQDVVHSTRTREADCCEQSPLRRDRMDIHKNARLTLRRRQDLVQHVAGGVTLKLAAANFSVTTKTVVKWVHRFRCEGPPGLFDRSSRPRRSPRRLPDSLADHAIQLRRQRLPGYLIAYRTRLSPAYVSRILRRARLSRWRDLDPPPPRAALRASRTRRSAASRYQRHVALLGGQSPWRWPLAR
jgi:leucine-zipper of insertion element IS481